jgi:formamidopyrimidine-DNA glycosylase
MRVTPIESEFTFEYFGNLIDEVIPEKKRSVKGLLTQDQLIPGMGNASAQDIMFRSHLHPKQPIDSLSSDQRQGLYHAILNTVNEIIEKGGRYDEYDLFNERGGYVRLMDKNAVGQPCADCGSSIEKMQYLGGACYLCPTCQILN